MSDLADLADLADRLSVAGCVAPEEEAEELLLASGGDPGRLEQMVARRVAGEPLAWITGTVRFAATVLHVDPGVYVPRQQTSLLVAAALELLPAEGLAVDLCTGSGAVAAAVGRHRPGARVVGTDIDPRACACARRNGVDVYEGDLDAGLPPGLRGRVDVVTAVAPYVPSDLIDYLPRDFRDHEPLGALDGGPDGTTVLERVAAAAARLLRTGGWLIVEVGGDQDELLAGPLRNHGFAPAEAVHDDDGDLRLLRASLR